MDFTQDAIAGEGVRRKVSVVKLINGHGGTCGFAALDRCYLSPCQVFKPAVTVDRSIDSDSRLVDLAWRQVATIQSCEPASSAVAVDQLHNRYLAPDSFAGYRILREIHRGGQGIV